MRTTSPARSVQTYRRMRGVVLGALIALAHTATGCNGSVDTQSAHTGGSTSGTGGGGGSTASAGGSSGDTCSGGQGGAGDTCPPDGYSGKVLPNGSELVVFKVDVARGICLRWSFSANDSPDPYGVEVTPPWSTTEIVVTNQLEDCALDDTGNLAPPKGDSVQAASAHGSVFVPTPWDPCDADTDATVSFEPVAPWVPEEELFDSPVVPLRKCGPE